MACWYSKIVNSIFLVFYRRGVSETQRHGGTETNTELKMDYLKCNVIVQIQLDP